MKLPLTIALFLCSLAVMGQKFDTEFQYTNAFNGSITIKNSLPKGGQKYRDSTGQEVVYAVFWTYLKNETAHALEISIEFPSESFTIPSSPGIGFQLLLPEAEMTLEKNNMFNYGLDIQTFLDANKGKPAVKRKTITPGDTYHFYVVVLSTKGVDGVIRAGFEMKDKSLLYKINGHHIPCGTLAIKR